jgi:hypothetical protein
MILFILEVAALCFPALLNRGPILFTDTHGYYMGGRAALRHAAALLAAFGRNRNRGCTT